MYPSSFSPKWYQTTVLTRADFQHGSSTVKCELINLICAQFLLDIKKKLIFAYDPYPAYPAFLFSAKEFPHISFMQPTAGCRINECLCIDTNNCTRKWFNCQYMLPLLKTLRARETIFYHQFELCIIV